MNCWLGWMLNMRYWPLGCILASRMLLSTSTTSPVIRSVVTSVLPASFVVVVVWAQDGCLTAAGLETHVHPEAFPILERQRIERTSC